MLQHGTSFLIRKLHTKQVAFPDSSHTPTCSGGALHRNLNARAAVYAVQHGLLHELTVGRAPSVIFGQDEAGRHGNFHPESYRAICADEDWRMRLSKAHTAGPRSRPRADWHWRELDCAASSDALLMNIFCHPRVFASGKVAALLGTDHGSRPRFGVHPRLTRERGLIDTTEIDMVLGDLLVEAKLTESGFQTARPALLDRFPDWREVFDEEQLPRTAGGAIACYQLLRGVLAAHEAGGSFCVLCDARRGDLISQWYAVLCAVRSSALRCRLKLLTWQELAACLPPTLRQFLADKYGIVSGESN